MREMIDEVLPLLNRAWLWLVVDSPLGNLEALGPALVAFAVLIAFLLLFVAWPLRNFRNANNTWAKGYYLVGLLLGVVATAIFVGLVVRLGPAAVGQGSLKFMRELRAAQDRAR